jgi:protein-S-isoprenylcysteine O-methyltransferase Ste14
VNISRSLIVALWLVFAVYWSVAAIGVKRSVGGRERRKAIALRLSVIVLILLAVRVTPLRHVLQSVQAQIANSVMLCTLGVLLCALGVGLAVWARMHLKGNWGMPMSRKENPELVMTGPYAFVRHPIYGGLLLAMTGSTIAASVFWVIPLILFGSYFIHSARREEAFMISQFPDEYPAYMRRSNMLLPWPGRMHRNHG